MRVQWEILLFLLVLNIVIGLCIALQVPSTMYITPFAKTVNATEYEAYYNATQIAKNWKATPFSGIPVIGDIFGGFGFLWQTLGYMLDGFPTLITWIGDSFITNPEGQTAFWILANMLRAIQAILITMFIIEFISGRIWTD